MNGYAPLILVVALALITPAMLLVVSNFLGARRTERTKGEPYECGIPQPAPPRRAIPVKYYLVAVLFLLFDVEAVFLYPWAVVYRRLGLFGFVEMAVFLAMLVAGLVYVWKRGALEWD
ncbi:MAG: NADH-quinone oxidoreductase subunit A [Candidatus Eisenbacteria bacterium]|nr:NADH-quinone oxidoreductase subunit A [Candidatus Eisenbacteria bacterium]